MLVIALRSNLLHFYRCVHILINLKYARVLQVIFIHSSDTDGRAFVGRFQTTSQNRGEDIEKKVQVIRHYNNNILMDKIITCILINSNV